MNKDELRARIDELDNAIIPLLRERAEICRKLGACKRKEGLDVRDEAREAVVFARADAAGKPVGEIYRAVVDACRAVQEEEQ